MAVVSMKSLLESGVHFGHRTHRWHPLMKPYIFTERNGIHIINLQLTAKALEEVFSLIRDTVAEDGTVLFVGTKRQAQETIENEAGRCGMPFVTARWLGGMLTNYRTIRERINELDRLERQRDSGEFDHLTKKEALMLNRKIEKLQTRFGGTRHMVGLPDLLFVVDVRREETSIHEANLLEIPVVAMVDTNCDPRSVDYIIPSNDDAIRAIKLIVSKIADAVLEGKALRKEEEEAEGFEGVAIEAVEAELSDEDLLGEATLAKLRDIEEEAEERAEVEEDEEEGSAVEDEADLTEAEEEKGTEEDEEGEVETSLVEEDSGEDEGVVEMPAAEETAPEAVAEEQEEEPVTEAQDEEAVAVAEGEEATEEAPAEEDEA